MFAKLKKKVEESEGSDLHRLANSITSATASLAEKTFSMSSIKSSENLSASSQRGSTTSLASLSGANIPNEMELQHKMEAKWKQRLTDIENEWRAKFIVKEHERDELSKEKIMMLHQIKQLGDKVRQLADYEEKYLEVEERIKHIQKEHLAETVALKSSLSRAAAEVEDLRTRRQQDLSLIDEFKSNNEGEKVIKLEGRLEELTGEVTELKEKLEDLRRSEAESQLSHREQQAALQLELEAERRKVEALAEELGRASAESRKVAADAEETSERLVAAVEDKDACLVRNAELSQHLSLCQQQLQRSQKELDEVTAKQDRLLEENQKLKHLLEDAEARDEHSERSDQLRTHLAQLEDQVQEKNKTIKLQQQRLSDMKKTLQRELKAPQSLVPEDNCHVTAISPSPSRKNPGTTIFPPSSPGPEANDSSNHLEPVNFKYLKHVIFKFLTSREYEAQHLTRAVSTLLKLSPEEDRLLKETLEWKMSWFRAKPDLGSGQNAMYIPPSH